MHVASIYVCVPKEQHCPCLMVTGASAGIVFCDVVYEQQVSKKQMIALVGTRVQQLPGFTHGCLSCWTVARVELADRSLMCIPGQ